MQWQTLESNAPSMAIGRALGYQPYCRTIAVRLRVGRQEADGEQQTPTES